MSSICLSPAPNLRCESLSWIESIVFLIPPGLEMIFALGLLVNKRRSRSRLHYLLSGEGIIYCLLATADLLAHLVPGIRNSFNVFKTFDIAIGILGTVPLALFTTYLYIFTARDLIPELPNRLQSVSKYTLLLCIPIILVFNELGSFDTLTYRMFGNIIAVKFMNEQLVIFFNSLTLVVLTAFQAINFCMAFYRLIKAIINQKRIDSTEGGNDREAHLINGIGWVSAGLKFGAIETVIGFAPGIFGTAITRRILRLLGRGCLTIGVVKGLDRVEDFRMFDPRERPIVQRRSRVLALISNPVDSSFRQIGGYKYETSYEPPAAVARSRPISEASPVPLSITLPKDRPITPPNDEKVSTPVLTLDTQNIAFSKQRRVIVRYGKGRAPTLEIQRLSGLMQSIPSPLTDYESRLGSLAASPEEEKSPMYPISNYTAGFSHPYGTALSDSPVIGLPDRKRVRPEARRTLAASTELTRLDARRSSVVLPRQSAASFGGQKAGARSNHLEILHALAMEFPGTPAGTSMQSVADTMTLSSASVSRTASERTTNSRSALVRRGSSRRKPVPAYNDLDSPQVEEALAIADDLEVIEDVEEPMSPSAPPMTPPMTPPQMSPPPMPQPLPASVSNSRTRFRSRSQGAATTQRYISTSAEDDAIRSPPIKSAGIRVEFAWGRSSTDIAAEGHAELDAAWKKMGLSRIKSIGSAPRRWTPTPSVSTSSRDSMAGELHDGDGPTEV